MADVVKYSVGYTVNMKDFESMRFDVGVETSVRDGETAKAAMERAKKFAQATLQEDIASAMESRGRL